jgi:bacterial microcompartment shell protein
MNDAIGGIELNSLAKGFLVADTMLKTSKVNLLLSRSVCPGKYIVLVSGKVADVTSSVNAGKECADYSLVDSFVVPNIHPDVLSAFVGNSEVTELEALGVVEAFSASAIVEAADTAVKTAPVRLIEVRLAMALGGKAFVSFTGSVASVTAAVNACKKSVGDKGLLVDGVVIAKPRQELLREMI